MTGIRRDIIAATLRTELGRSGHDDIDAESLADVIAAALEREEAPAVEPNEGTPPDALSSANDG